MKDPFPKKKRIILPAFYYWGGGRLLPFVPATAIMCHHLEMLVIDSCYEIGLHHQYSENYRMQPPPPPTFQYLVLYHHRYSTCILIRDGFAESENVTTLPIALEGHIRIIFKYVYYTFHRFL